MKTIFNTNTSSGSTDLALLMARLMVAALMLTHGLPKMDMLFSEGPVQFPPVMGMNAALSLTLTVFAEVVCSFLILAGFATRLAVIPLMIVMAVAVFSIHASDPFAKKELAVFYLVVYGLLLIAGSGKYSIDQLMQGSREKIPVKEVGRYIYQ